MLRHQLFRSLVVQQQSSLENEPEVGKPDYNSRMMEKIRQRKELKKNDQNQTWRLTFHMKWREYREQKSVIMQEIHL